MTIDPNCYFADNDASTRAAQAYTGEVNDDSLFSFKVTAASARAYAGVRIQTGSKAVVYFPQPPQK